MPARVRWDRRASSTRLLGDRHGRVVPTPGADRRFCAVRQADGDPLQKVEALFGVRHRLGQGDEARGVFGLPVAEQECDVLRHVAEVMVEGALRHPEPLAQGGDGQAAVPTLGQELEAGLVVGVPAEPLGRHYDVRRR